MISRKDNEAHHAMHWSVRPRLHHSGVVPNAVSCNAEHEVCNAALGFCNGCPRVCNANSDLCNASQRFY